jgi:hypothetical protein
MRSLVAVGFVLGPSMMTPVQAATDPVPNTFCARSRLCADLADSESLGYYSGHDEPALLFYSDEHGSGHSMTYRLQLPIDAPERPNADGTGGTWNFQLHPAFWFGMAMCDSTSAPEFTHECTPDSDSNIFEDANPASDHYIGKHPGTAFTELQFYPPGWVKWPGAEANAGGTSCDARRWCAALNVDSLLEDMNTADPKKVVNNADCRRRAGDETINFAFLTKTGKSIAPADPLIAFAGLGRVASPTFTPDPDKLAFFNPGDTLEVHLHDSADGLVTTVTDLDSGEVGSMTASMSNGFAHLLFQPNATKCDSEPYNFHPMYDTSSEHTRVVWAAHSYNIAFSDEIGHFEYCNGVAHASIVAGTGVCTEGGATDGKARDADDNFCFNALMSSFIRIKGCTDSDVDFDGPSYGRNWPGTAADRAADRNLHGTAIRLTSPLSRTTTNYERVAYETDLPRIEANCDRRVTGAHCTNPPQGASFYPIYTFGNVDADNAGENPNRAGDFKGCIWREGGRFLADTAAGNFASSESEYGPLLRLTYPGPGFAPITRLNDFRRVLSNNPCRTQR